MRRTEVSTKLINGFSEARRRPMRLFAILGLVAVIAASCGSEATTTSAGDAAADDQSSVTTTTAEVEVVTTTTVPPTTVTTTTTEPPTTTVEPEPEPEPDIEGEAIPAPDADVIAFTEAFGVADSDKAWSYVSARCDGGSSVPGNYVQAVDGYAAAYPGATAEIVRVVFGDSDTAYGDTAYISYNVFDGS